MSLLVKRDGTALWRGEKVGTLKKRLTGTRQGEHVFDWTPLHGRPLVADNLMNLKDRITRELLAAERAAAE